MKSGMRDAMLQCRLNCQLSLTSREHKFSGKAALLSATLGGNERRKASADAGGTAIPLGGTIYFTESALYFRAFLTSVKRGGENRSTRFGENSNFHPTSRALSCSPSQFLVPFFLFRGLSSASSETRCRLTLKVQGRE